MNQNLKIALETAKKVYEIDMLIDFIIKRYKYDSVKKNKLLDKLAIKNATINEFPLFIDMEMSGSFKHLLIAYKLSIKGTRLINFCRVLHLDESLIEG